MRGLPIGVVAQCSGIAVSALRYDDQLGLLGDVPCAAAGARQFPTRVLCRLALIRAAQEAGFTLAEIKLLLDQRPDVSVRQQWEALASRRLPELDPDDRPADPAARQRRRLPRLWLPQPHHLRHAPGGGA